MRRCQASRCWAFLDYGEGSSEEPFGTSFHLTAEQNRADHLWVEKAASHAKDILPPHSPCRQPRDAFTNVDFGHEGHHAECTDTALNALKADIQAMGEGEAH